MGLLSFLGWLIVGGTFAKEAIEDTTQNTIKQKVATYEYSPIYYDNRAGMRLTSTNEKVYRSRDKRGDLVYKSLKTNRIVFNESEHLAEIARNRAIEEGKAFYIDQRPEWKKALKVDVETRIPYELKEYGGKYYREDYQEVESVAGFVYLWPSFNQYEISKEEFIKFGGTPRFKKEVRCE